MTNETDNQDPIYFTIMPSNAGFTDQLFQFNTFYKLGRSLGYNYLHSDFTNARHGSEDIYDFLGFNEHFAGKKLTRKTTAYRFMGTNNCLGKEGKSWKNKLKRKVKFWTAYTLLFREFNFIDIGLGQTVPLDESQEPVEGLKTLIRKLVSQKAKSNSKQKNVVRFYLTSGRAFFGAMAPLINQQIPYFPDKLDLRSTYFKLRQTRPVPSRYAEGKIKLLVHIRLGDTALIETPWHSFIPLWSDLCVSPLKEYPDRSDGLFGQVMDVDDFVYFLKKFNASFVSDRLSIAVFSDGHKTAFKELFRQIDDLKLSSDKIRALQESAPTYEQKKFSVFDDVKNCVRLVGETNEDLQELVHSALTADVIVVGSHQRMIPKFLATYYDVSLKHPPVIISLYRGRVPRYQLKIGLDERKAKLYPIDITRLKSDEALTDLVQEIKQRHHVA